MSVSKRYKGKRITPKDKNWSKGTYYIWKRIGGRIIHKALKGAQTKAEAEAAEREIIRRAFNQRYGIQDDTDFRDFAKTTYTQYVEQRNINRTAKRQYIELLSAVFKGQALAQITPQDCRNAQAKFRKKYSASSVNLIMSTASKIFTLACQEGILDRNPMQYVPRLKEPPPRNRLLSKEEWERLWEQLERDVLMFRFVLLAVNLPLRKGQLLALTETAVDFPNGLLSVIGSKGRAARFVPLNSGAATTLRLMIEDGQLPFPLKETGIRKRWIRILAKAKIEGLRIHDLRHYVATELDRKGITGETIRKLFGHSDMKITRVYINPEMETMRAAVNTLDEVQEIGEQ